MHPVSYTHLKQQWTQELEKWLRDGVVFPENPEPMLRIGKSYLGTKYVANTLDQDEMCIRDRRIGVSCISDKLYHRSYPGLTKRYGGGTFGTVFIHRVLYALSLIHI